MNLEQKKRELLELFYNNSSVTSKMLCHEEILELCNKQSFPTRKTDSWKYTDLSPILKQNYEIAKQESITPNVLKEHIIKNLDVEVIVLVNGFYIPDLSEINTDALVMRRCIDDKTCKNTIAGIVSKQNLFAALSTAYPTNKLTFEIQPNRKIQKPLHIISFTTKSKKAQINQPVLAIDAKTNCKADIIESYYSLDENSVHFTNSASTIHLGENAQVNLYRYQEINSNSFHINNMVVEQQKNSSFKFHTISLTGKILRHQLLVKQKDINCHTGLYGLYLPGETDHHDNFTYISHQHSHSTSNQLYKGIINHKASAVFYGMAYVASQAQKIDAYQSNKNILLTDNATVNSRPQLEIYADDVKCSNGSTTGQLDSEALFYLQTRGIHKDQAKALLLYAFATEVIEAIAVKPFRQFISQAIEPMFLSNCEYNQEKLH